MVEQGWKGEEGFEVNSVRHDLCDAVIKSVPEHVKY